jgi:hypothetical protein
MDTFVEPSRELLVGERCDVVVCGGGPAGFAAAMAAARMGASVRLLEVAGCLGGIWTSGLLAWFLDTAVKGGLMSEIIAELEAMHERPVEPGPRINAYNPELVKLLLERMCQQQGVRVQLHTRVVSGALQGRRLALAISESKSGRQAWGAKAFVDATGDGDLAARVGCKFEYGVGHRYQPMSLIAVLAGPRYHDISQFVDSEASTHKQRTAAFRAEMNRAGIDPSYGAPALFLARDELYVMMSNHEYGYSGLSAADVTAATMRARAEIAAQVRALRGLGGPWARLQLVATGSQIGTRESRRIHGLYTVVADDLVAGRRHEDGVCRVTFPVDVHATDKSRGKAYDDGGIRSQPYDIPLRAQIAADVDGLLTAGRCISGDFLAHASYRVTGNAVALGQSAGVTAALAARAGCLPHEVPWQEVRQALQRLGALPLDNPAPATAIRS